MPKFGELIVVSITLFDGDTTQFPQAIVQDNNGTPLPGSPLSLSHVVNGYYENKTLTMPNISFAKAIITVYDDVAHTIISTIHSSASAVYPLEVPFGDILSQFQILCDKLDQLLQSEFLADLSAIIRADERFSAKLMQVQNLSAKLNSMANLRGEIIDPEQLKSTATGQTITANLKDC